MIKKYEKYVKASSIDHISEYEYSESLWPFFGPLLKCQFYIVFTMQFALSSRNQFDAIGGLALACYTIAHAQSW